MYMDLPDFFGIDIGDHSAKLAQLKLRGDGQADFQRVGFASLPFGFLDNDSDEGLKKLASELKSAKEAAEIGTNNCVAAIPEAPIFSRLLTIPKVEADKVEETVHWELKPLIPVPLEQVDIAFLEVVEFEQAGQSLIDIYAVASPKQIVEKFKQICTFAGFNLIALETESLANTRAVSFSYGIQANAIIVDFGSLGTDVILAREGVPVFAQTIGSGSDALTKAIAADYSITEQQAEQYKKAYGMRYDQGEGKIAKSIEPIMQLIVSEINRTITYLKQRMGDTQTTSIYFVGEGSNLPGLAEYIQQQLNMGAVMVDPIGKITTNDKIKEYMNQHSNPAGYSVAIGLGLKDS